MKQSRSKVVPADERRSQVRDRYATIATGGQVAVAPLTSSCCGGSAGSSCCGGGASPSCCGDSSVSLELGYTPEQLAGLPDGANLGLGCGNPTAIAALMPGQTVLDLGSGAGIDCFLAAKKVGARGSVVGVDMTPEMLLKARENARKGGYRNVEFRLGEIEHLPVAEEEAWVMVLEPITTKHTGDLIDERTVPIYQRL